MKKILAGLMMFFVFAITVPLTVDAQSCRTRNVRRSSYNRNYARPNRRYANRNYNNYRYASNDYIYERRPSFYRRHRNLINVGIGTGAGALIGALVGGKRGALIGAAAGAGGGALYTYGINPKKRRYYRRY